MAANYYGLNVTGVKNPQGKWFNQYINPATSQQNRQQLYGQYGKRYGWMDPAAVAAAHNPPAPAAPPPAAPPPETPKVATPETTDTSAMFPGRASGLTKLPEFGYKTVESFLPTNPQADAIYKWQEKQGRTALEQAMAARGQMNSSAENSALSDFYTQLGSEQAKRLTDVATTNAMENNKASTYKYGADTNILGQEAARAADMAQNESMRRAGQDQFNWQKMRDVWGMLQDISPLTMAYNSTNNLANVLGQIGQTYGQGYTNIGTIPQQSSSSSSSRNPFNPYMTDAYSSPNAGNNAWSGLAGDFFNRIPWASIFGGAS